MTNIEFTPEDEEEFNSGFLLLDGHVWMYSPDCLNPEDCSEGIIGMMFYEGVLYYMLGGEREWVTVPHKGAAKAKNTNTLRSIDGR